MVTKKKFCELQDKVSYQEGLIQSLIAKVSNLETSLTQITAEKAVVSHINDFLLQKIDDLAQYGRRSCLLLEGVPCNPRETVFDVENSVKKVLEEELGFEKTKIDNEFDKAHRIGPIKANNQKVIIRFKSHSFQNSVYKARKNDGVNPRYKFKPSLTQRREELVNFARDTLSSYPNFHFAYADSNITNEYDILQVIAVIDDYANNNDELYHIDDLFPMPSKY